MTMTTQPYVPTQGPSDPNAPAVQKVYTIISAVLGLAAVASSFHVITTDQSTALANLGTTLVGFIGAGITALAAFRTKKQLANGTFDAAPTDHVANVFDSLNQIKQSVDATVSHAQTQVISATAAIQGAASMIPAGGILSSAILSGPVGDLIQSVADHGVTEKAPGQPA